MLRFEHIGDWSTLQYMRWGKCTTIWVVVCDIKWKLCHECNGEQLTNINSLVQIQPLVWHECGIYCPDTVSCLHQVQFANGTKPPDCMLPVVQICIFLFVYIFVDLELSEPPHGVACIPIITSRQEGLSVSCRKWPCQNTVTQYQLWFIFI